MKKLLTLTLSLALCCGSFVFVACKKDNPAPQSSESTPVSEPSSDEQSDASSENSGETSGENSDESDSGTPTPDTSSDMME